MDILNQLRTVYNTLEMVEVKGANNIAYMFGSLNVLRELIVNIEKPLEESKKDGE